MIHVSPPRQGMLSIQWMSLSRKGRGYGQSCTVAILALHVFLFTIETIRLLLEFLGFQRS